MKNFKGIKLAAVFLCAGLALVSCSKAKAESGEQLYVYNWGEYIDEEVIKEFEKENIINLIKIYGDNLEAKKIIAKSLGIGIATLYRKLKKY